MTCDDFYKVVGLIIHFGFRKIPAYRMAWSPECLCYDPFVASVMSRNRFESLMAFVHLVDATTEKELKDKGDKLSKVRPVYTHLQERCLALYQPNAEISSEIKGSIFIQAVHQEQAHQMGIQIVVFVRLS